MSHEPTPEAVTAAVKEFWRESPAITQPGRMRTAIRAFLAVDEAAIRRDEQEKCDLRWGHLVERLTAPEERADDAFEEAVLADEAATQEER